MIELPKRHYHCGVCQECFPDTDDGRHHFTQVENRAMQVTFEELQQLLQGQDQSSATEELSQDGSPYVIGEKYLLRCVTMYYTGRLVRETQNELVFEDAAWVADTGRFHDCLKTGKLNEVEPFTGPVIIPKGTIVDVTVWQHDLPQEQK